MGGLGWRELGLRPALFPATAFVAGAVLVGDGATPPTAWAALAVGLGAAAWSRARRAGAHLLVLLAFFSLGGAIALVHARALGVPDDDLPHRVRGAVQARSETPDGPLLRLQVLDVDGAPARFGLALGVTGEVAVSEGDVVAAVTRVRERLPAMNPGEWSSFPRLARGAQQWVGGCLAERVVRLEPAPPPARWLQAQHASLVALVQARDAGPAGSVVLTLAAGQRAALTEALEDDFARSGLAHVLSVSGLHVAALAVAVFTALRLLVLRLPWRRLRRVDARQLAAPLAVPWLWAYVAFTGWQPPAVRSGLMASLVFGGYALLRRADSLNALALAALVMTALDAAAPFDLSVQLSFLSLLALIVVSPRLRALIPVEPPHPSRQAGWRLRLARVRETALGTLCASAAVTLVTGPLLLLVFQRLGLAGLVSNVVLLPLLSVLVVVCAGLAVASVVAPWAAPVLAALAIWLAALVVRGASFFAALPLAAVELPPPPPLLAAVFIAAVLATCLARGRLRWVGLAAPLAVLAHAATTALHANDTSVTFLAVGHGDAIVLSSEGHHALIDGGGVPGGVDTGRKHVLPFLRARGIRRLDLAVLTHAHPDHALGLASTLLDVPADRVWLPRGSPSLGLLDDVEDAAAGATVERAGLGTPPLRLGALTISVLGPTPALASVENERENDRSIVLEVTHGDVSFLLTGDIEAAAEASLTVRGPVTVLKAPHHGSRTSSTPPFVAQTKPRYVVFSAARKSRHGFPHPEVSARYQAAGAEAFRTGVDGAITFTSDGRRVFPAPFLR